MPTPFSHLYIGQRLLHDSHLTDEAAALLHAQRAAFLLGSIIADAKVPGEGRAYTHFYHYTEPMPDNPWREMLRQHPTLKEPDAAAHEAFMAGYVAHLAADEYWTRYMLAPHFADGDWGASRRDRFYVLHLLLIHMDERDEARLDEGSVDTMQQGTPHEWLPFMDDSIICEWRDYIAEQIRGESETVSIFAGRLGADPDDLRDTLNDSAAMHKRLWQHITPEMLQTLEADLYAFARQQMHIYIKMYLQDVYR